MRTDDIAAFFAAQGLPLHWLVDGGGRPLRALLANGQPLALHVDAAVVIPDVHLGIGRGDSFQETDATRVTRLERFLDVLARLRDSMPAGRFAAVQLGDFFDVMRTSQPGASFEDRLAIVLRAYPDVTRAATALPLLHCIGNHDHELFDHRAELPALGINAHIVRAIGPGVLAFHGNDFVSLADIELDVEYQTWLLSLVQSLVQMPLVGGAVAALQRVFDASLQDPVFGNTSQTSVAWPAAPASASLPVGWSAPWVVRDGAAQLGVPLLGWEKGVGRQLDLAILGHSHRPGIGWTQVDFDRRIPLVDVGSWTYGRTNFAVVGTDGVGLAIV
jgi:hypothetical protein